MFKRTPDSRSVTDSRFQSQVVSTSEDAEGSHALLAEVLSDLAEGQMREDLDGLAPDVAQAVRELARRIGARDERSLSQTVEFSIQASEAMAATARITGEIRETDLRAQNMAAAVEELTASIDQIAETAKSAALSMEDVSRGMTNGAEATRSTAEASRQIGASFERMTTTADHLAQAAEQIGTFVATIDGLSRQTNLLALNATIEAARAGVAGRGFAVVASEVKVLSGETQKATDDIRSRIERLSDHVHEMLETVHEVQDLVQGSVDKSEEAADQISHMLDDVALNGERMNEISNVLAQQAEAVQEVSAGAQSIAEHSGTAAELSRDVIDFVGRSERIVAEQFKDLETRDVPNFILHRAKADHLMWKKRLAEMLVGLQSLSGAELSDHHQCRLGAWYDRTDDVRITSHPAYRALLPVHESVHACAREAVERHGCGDSEGALEAMEKMGHASTEVLRHLDTLIGVRHELLRQASA